MALDIPDAAHQLSLFLGRIIVDEALPPSFLTSVLVNLRNDSLGVSVVQATGMNDSQSSTLPPAIPHVNRPKPGASICMS